MTKLILCATVGALTAVLSCGRVPEADRRTPIVLPPALGDQNTVPSDRRPYGPLVILNGRALLNAEVDSALLTLRGARIDSIRVYLAGDDAAAVCGSRCNGGAVIIDTRRP